MPLSGERAARRACALVAAVLCLMCAPAARAITNGAADDGRHPAVGGLVSHNGHDKKLHLICSGALISPSVFLTAAHCLVGEPSQLYVSFDAFIGSPDVGKGVTRYHGSAFGDPAFKDEKAPGDTHDVAVIKLDSPIRTITPLSLPYQGQLDHPPSAPTLVGYGREGYDGTNFFGGGGRRFATGAFSSLEAYKLILDQHGTIGGTCNGDSGGPLLLPGTTTIGAVTSDGDANCQINGIYYRLDTASARAFLGQYVPLPQRPSGPRAPVTPAPAQAGPAVRPVVGGRVSARFVAAAGGGVRAVTLSVAALPAGAIARLRCIAPSGAHCVYRVTRLRGGRVRKLSRRARSHRLPRGARLELRLSAPGHLDRVVRWRVTARGAARLPR